MSEIRLILGDCLEVLPSLAAQSVEAIITDLPYGTTACSWDEIIPFEPMWREVKRLLKPRGVFVTTASQPFTSKLVMSNLEWFRYEWIWEKSISTGFLDASKRPLKSHENILTFSCNGHIYHPQKWEISERFIDRRKTFSMIAEGAQDVYRKRNPRKHAKDDGTRFPLSVLSISSERLENQHPTQKPVALYEYLIRTYTNEGDTVLDFCMGSGTTLVACLITNRNGIGIELREDYYRIAEKRIAQAQLQVRMPI